MSTSLLPIGARRAVIEELLGDAIARHLLVRIAFDGCVRDIQPHALTRTARGLSAEATQIGGMTRSLPERGTRVFALHAIDDAAPMDDRLVRVLPWFRLPMMLCCTPMQWRHDSDVVDVWAFGMRLPYHDHTSRGWWADRWALRWTPASRTWSRPFGSGDAELGRAMEEALDHGCALEVRDARHQRRLQALFRAQGFRDDVPVPTVRYYTEIPPADTLWWAASDAERPRRPRRLPRRRLPAARRALPARDPYADVRALLRGTR